MPFTNRKFGIEIEGFGLTERQIFNVFETINISCNLPDDDYDGNRIPTPNSWVVKKDYSVRDNSGNETSTCFEVISPPLSGPSGLEQTQRVVCALKTAGGRTNKSCGLHVHVDAEDLKAVDLANIVIQYNNHEAAIDSFMPISRRNNNYCMSLRNEAEQMRRDILSIASANNPAEFVENYFSDRYRKVNLDAYLRHGTVEFRQHSGTVNEEKIINWVKFCVNFVERCKIPESNIVLNPVVVAPAEPEITEAFPLMRARGRISDISAKIVRYLNRRINVPVPIPTLVALTAQPAHHIPRFISEIRQRYSLTTQQLPHRADTYFLRGIRLEIAPERNVNDGRIRSVYLSELETPFSGLPVEIASFYQERAMEFAVR